MFIDELGRNYYLIVMLLIAFALAALGRRWSEQERREQDSKKSPHSSMDRARASEARDPGSSPGGGTKV